MKIIMKKIVLIVPIFLLMITSCEISENLVSTLNDYNYEMDVTFTVSLSSTAYFGNDRYEVTLTSNKPGAQILYTLDSTDPTPANGTIYAGAGSLILTSTTTIKAAAYYDGNLSSVFSRIVYVTADGLSATTAYRLYNATHLHNLASLVNSGDTSYNNKYYIQIANISVSTYNTDPGWTPIGIDGNPFKGTFDGGSFTISGLYINDSTGSSQGLFGNIEGAVLQNINLSGASVTGGTAVGALAGYVSNSSINGCSTTATVTGSSRVGGFAGRVITSTITNCVSTSTVNGTTEYIGGFSGSIQSSSLVTGCNANTTISSQGIDTGGFAGMIYTSVIENCYADGDITAVEVNSGGFAGYTFGYSDGTTETCTTISGCYSTANITSSGNNTGGFIGTIYNFSQIEKCYSTGEVISDGNNTGGFAGNTEGNLKSTTPYVLNTTISKSYSSGNVTSSAKNTGGFIGYIYVSTIDNCYSVSEISSTGENYGGFIGSDFETSTWPSYITNCYYAGIISTTGTNGGGFIGLFSENLNLISCLWLQDTSINNTFTEFGPLYSAGIPYTTVATVTEMQNQSTFTGFDFTTIWVMGTSYPLLQ